MYIKDAIISTFIGLSITFSAAAQTEETPASALEDVTPTKHNQTFAKTLQQIPDTYGITYLMDMNHSEENAYQFLIDSGLQDMANAGYTLLLVEMLAEYKQDVTALNKGNMSIETFMERNPDFRIRFFDNEKDIEIATKRFLTIVTTAGQFGIDVGAIDSGAAHDFYEDENLKKLPKSIREAQIRVNSLENAVNSYAEQSYGRSLDEISSIESKKIISEYLQRYPLNGRQISDYQKIQEYYTKTRLDDRQTAKIAKAYIQNHKERFSNNSGKVAILYGGGHIATDHTHGLDEQLKEFGSSTTIALYSTTFSPSTTAYAMASYKYQLTPADVNYIASGSRLYNQDGTIAYFADQDGNEITLGGYLDFYHEIIPTAKVKKPCYGPPGKQGRRLGCAIN